MVGWCVSDWETFTVVLGHGDEAEVQARLMAAAPDLLAACRALFDFSDVLELGRVGVQMKAAIAKATGER